MPGSWGVVLGLGLAMALMGCTAWGDEHAHGVADTRWPAELPPGVTTNDSEPLSLVHNTARSSAPRPPR